MAVSTSRLAAASAFVSLGVSLSACSSVGDQCDLAAAQTVAYRADGLPAYAGQALVLSSCGGASFCHAATATNRFGAPFDLNFDVFTTDGAPDEATHLRYLANAQRALHRHRDLVFATVSGGSMPPRADQMNGTALEMPGLYRTYASATDTTGTPLPDINSTEGQAVLRNWLACGSPVVQATTEPAAVPCATNADCTSNLCEAGFCRLVGAIVPGRTTEPAPTFSSIYAAFVAPNCVSGCHTTGGQYPVLDLSSEALAYTSLTSETSTCTGEPYVIPNDAANSYLLPKVGDSTPARCGSVMPLVTGGMGLPQTARDRIRAWITAGAPR